MKQMSPQTLTAENFKEYGTFTNLLDPKGPKMGAEGIEFFRDMQMMHLGNSSTAAFSICRSSKRPKIVSFMEYCNFTEKSILPLDGNTIAYFAVATPSDDVPMDNLAVFYVPKGTIVTLKPGVWHMAPFPVDQDAVNILISTVERGYKNDCIGIAVPEKDQVEIV